MPARLTKFRPALSLHRWVQIFSEQSLFFIPIFIITLTRYGPEIFPIFQFTNDQGDQFMFLLILTPVLAAILMISISWTTFRGAPWVPSMMHVVHRMLKLAETGPGDIVYDLGCGDGRLLIAAVRRYGARAVGFEIDPLRYVWCQILITVLGLRGRVKVVFGDFFSKNLSGATVVTCYLLQDTNNRLAKKLQQELNPGTRVVSHTFAFPHLQKMCESGQVSLYLPQFDETAG